MKAKPNQRLSSQAMAFVLAPEGALEIVCETLTFSYNEAPVLDGLKQSRDLPNACTMNGRCAEVCPVGIPLPTLLRAWRIRSWREKLEPGALRVGISLWAMLAKRPALYRLASRIGVRAIRMFGKAGWISRLPLAGGWTTHRDMPRPTGRTFMEQYRAEQAKKGGRP